MADHIPFITGDEACGLAREMYSDSPCARISLDSADRHCPRLMGTTMKLWIDPCLDGVHDLISRGSDQEWSSAWLTLMRTFPHFEEVATPGRHARPDRAKLEAFVAAVLDKCKAYKPAWITVPQLPFAANADRNKINRELALAAGKWRNANSFPGRLILPLVFTSHKQVQGRKERAPRIQQAERCYRMAQADGFWTVEAKLREDECSSTLGKQFGSLVALQEELNAAITSRIRIAGPYWGLNLVLWARGLVDYPAIGVGSGYQMLLAGGHARQGEVRLAVCSLRRRVSYTTALLGWLDEAVKTLAPSHPARKELEDIKKRFTALGGRDSARRQVATFYKQWFQAISDTPSAGRSMALFQDLSAAYALGKSLKDLPEKGMAREPEAVAKHLMLNCL